MAIFNVKKDGTGTHTEIQSAIYDAVSGDTVEVGPGLFEENVEIFSKSIKLYGAGRDLTTIQGKLTSDTVVCSWFAGDTVLNTTSTAALRRGKLATGTNITTNSRISEIISPTQFRLSLATATTGNYTKTAAAYQTLSFSVAPTSGTFKLNYKGVDTAAINWNDSASTIQTKIRAVAGLSTVLVTGTISGKLLNITFDSVALPVEAFTISSNTLLTNVTITVALIEALTSGLSTIVLPNTTSVAVGHKVEGSGVNAIITAINTTTKTITLSEPITQTGSGVVLSFRLPRNNVTVSQVTNPSTSSGPASIMIAGITDGVEVKNLTAIGFDGVVGQEASAIFFTAGTAPGHTNWLIDNCRFTANGDSAIMCGSNPYLSGGTVQNCIIDGKTFTGSEPADIPSFSTFIAQGTIVSIGASSSVINFPDLRGIIVGRTFTAAAAFTGSATISAINGNEITFNKVSLAPVDSIVDCTFTLTAYSIPNAARNLVYIGQNTSPNNTTNISFLNNKVYAQTGAVISATGNRSMFNSAVSIEATNSLIQGNVLDGIYGAGEPNPLMSNYAIRCRQTGTIVKDNICFITGGRGNSGFFVPFGTELNNQLISKLMIQATQAAPGELIHLEMDKTQIKYLTSVANSVKFSDELNWKLVTFIYKKSTSTSRMATAFRDFSAVRQKLQRPDMVAGDQLQLVKIIVSDSTRDLLAINRAELSNPELYDFTLV